MSAFFSFSSFAATIWMGRNKNVAPCNIPHSTWCYVMGDQKADFFCQHFSNVLLIQLYLWVSWNCNSGLWNDGHPGMEEVISNRTHGFCVSLIAKHTFWKFPHWYLNSDVPMSLWYACSVDLTSTYCHIAGEDYIQTCQSTSSSSWSSSARCAADVIAYRNSIQHCSSPQRTQC